jgi:hypothetical protein
MSGRYDRIRKAAYVAEAAGHAPARVPPPLLGGEIWQEVIDRADGQCECGECGAACHPKKHQPCALPNRPGSPLHAVPAKPIDMTAAAALKADALIALCDGCHGAYLLRIKKDALKQAQQASKDEPALFEVMP